MTINTIQRKDWSKYKPDVFTYKGKYISNWFSNMVPVELDIFGYKYNSVENFYQAMKSGNSLEHHLIASCTPYESKKLGRGVLNPFEYLKGDSNIEGIFQDHRLNEIFIDTTEIDRVKIVIMYIGLVEKFKVKRWKEKLMDTSGEPIVEWNNWSDVIWGVDVKTGRGANILGRLLIHIRDNKINQI